MSIALFIKRIANRVLAGDFKLPKKEQPKHLKTRHHRSKHYKKQKEIEDVIVLDTENINHDLCCELAKEFWNSFNATDFIERITREFLPLKTKRDQNKYLEKEYYRLLNRGFINLEDLSPSAFVTIFGYNIPNFFKPWLKEIEIANRKYIKGDIFNGVISFLFDKKSVKIERIYDHFVYEFEATIKSSVTKLIKKGYIKEISINEKLFYAISENVKCDGGYYLEEG